MNRDLGTDQAGAAYSMKKVRARYISDIPDDYLKKGSEYDCFYIELKGWLGYTDDHGENYAVPSDRFEILA